jgi:hypothetical protein
MKVRQGRLLAVAGALAMTLGLSAAALANSTATLDPGFSSTETATVQVASGGFNAGSENFTAPAQDPTIGAQTQDATLTSQGEVFDFTGMGDGWTVTASGGPLTIASAADLAQGENPAAVGATLPGPGTGGAETLSASNVRVAPTVPGSEAVSGITTNTVLLNGTAQTLLQAAPGEGMGGYEFDETLSYEVPPNAYQGTYSTTITITGDENPAPPSGS